MACMFIHNCCVRFRISLEELLEEKLVAHNVVGGDRHVLGNARRR